MYKINFPLQSKHSAWLAFACHFGKGRLLSNIITTAGLYLPRDLKIVSLQADYHYIRTEKKSLQPD